MSILSDFIETEREQYSNGDNNVFASSLGQALRYYGFLMIIAERYKKTCRKMTSTFNKIMNSSVNYHPMTTEENRLYEESNRLNTQIQLEIESFYLFAKIFLDKIALFIEKYFGQSRGISITSHDKWTKDHNKFCLNKDLTCPASFSKSIIFLKEHIVDYRDKQIVHLYNQRTIKGIAWDVTKSSRIITTHLNQR